MLKIKNITKTYHHKKHKVEIIKNLNLSIKNGEFIAIVGPSGCGKTTLLKIIAGLIKPTTGQILLDRMKITKPGRDRGMVFQQFTLFPWLTVKENISFGLDLRKIKTNEKEKIIDHFLEITELKDFADYYPKKLSGGMQQRVAIARTLANDPKILLMDEPFSALDSQTKENLHKQLEYLWRKLKKTIIFVTHDLEEAIFLADRIFILTERPARLKEIMTVRLPRPRKPGIKLNSKFIKMRRNLIRLTQL